MIKTALYNQHEKLSAKIVSYAGYAMPVSYKNGINSEYFSEFLVSLMTIL